MEEPGSGRHGRPQGGGTGLLEREEVLRSIELAVAGAGPAVLLEGHPGMGKTRLHDAAVDLARAGGMAVLRATGTELEREYAFGVAIQLVRSALAELSDERAAAIIAQAPERVQGLLGMADPSPQPPAEVKLAVCNGLLALVRELVAGRRALIAIDDLHWSDESSLDFLLFLLQRVDELPAAVVMARRHGTRGDTSGPLDELATQPRVIVHRLAPLAFDAVAQLVRDSLGERAEPAVVEACFEATAGNPFYVRELVGTLAEEKEASPQALAALARSLVPDAVTRIVRVRVGRLGAEPAGVAAAVATLGNDVPLRQAATLAGLPLDRAADAADALAAVDVLVAREPLAFVHPLVRHAIFDDMPASARASRHLDAARLLHAEGAPAMQVAGHLLLGRAQGDEWAVVQLLRAARDAYGRGAPESAVRFLERALQEPPGPERRGEVLAELGLARAAMGIASASEDLARAISLTPQPQRRAELALERGRILDGLGRHEQAARVFDAGIAELDQDPGEESDRELRDQLQVAFVSSATLVPRLHARSLRRVQRLLERLPPVPAAQGERLLLAYGSLQASFDGRPAGEVVELAERAWDEGRVLEFAASTWLGWRLACAGMILAGELERAVKWVTAALQDAEEDKQAHRIATARFVRALPRLWQADVDGALEDLEFAARARTAGWAQFSRAAAAQQALCLIEKGEVAEAEAVLLDDGGLPGLADQEDAMRMYSLAELRLAQGRPDEALEAALACGELGERTVRHFGYCSWRMAAAQAHLAREEPSLALELALEAAERSERTGVLHQRIGALRVLASCQQGDERLATLQRAVSLGARGPRRLETIRALIGLGSALRRENERTAARAPLARAADLARQGGATALEELARAELGATGARPRRETLTDGPQALTPSERRIAQLARAGQSNREISAALFVTPKTVEYHLRNTFRKLGITNRSELDRSLD